MTKSSHTGRLILAPADARQAPDPSKILDYLKEIDFVGAPLDLGQGEIHLIGDAFLRLITFMGCSPHIQLSPQQDGAAFCHIRLSGPEPAPLLLYGQNTQPPRCTACRGRLNEWQAELTNWQQNPLANSINCKRCGHAQRPIDLQWKQNAGFVRLSIAIEDVFPGEAVPVPSLLQGLEKTSGIGWRYFYIQD